MHEVKQKVKDALCDFLKCQENDLAEKMRGLFQVPEKQDEPPKD